MSTKLAKCAHVFRTIAFLGFSFQVPSPAHDWCLLPVHAPFTCFSVASLSLTPLSLRFFAPPPTRPFPRRLGLFWRTLLSVVARPFFLARKARCRAGAAGRRVHLLCSEHHRGTCRSQRKGSCLFRSTFNHPPTPKSRLLNVWGRRRSRPKRVWDSLVLNMLTSRAFCERKYRSVPPRASLSFGSLAPYFV